MPFAQGVLTAAELVERVKDDIEKLKATAARWFKEKPQLTGLPTGLENLDSLIGGLVVDEVVVLAGDPGGGKTALLIQMLERSARHHVEEGTGLVNVIFSAEMPKRTLLTRGACRLAHIDSMRLRKGDVTPEELGRYNQALEYLKGLPLLWIDTPGMTSELILNAVSILQQHEGIKFGVIGVDYIQQLYDEGQNDTTRIPVIMRNLIRAKAESEACLIALSQYSRRKTVEHRAPQLEDLLGSGVIGRSADQVWMLHDPEVEEFYQGSGPKAVRKELYIRKNRNGPQGTLSLWYRPSFTQFFSPAAAKPANVAQVTRPVVLRPTSQETAS